MDVPKKLHIKPKMEDEESKKITETEPIFYSLESSVVRIPGNDCYASLNFRNGKWNKFFGTLS